MNLEDKQSPSFYVIIPATIRYNKKLTDGAKLLYGEVGALCNIEGYCRANNFYFSKLYDVTTRTIQSWIEDLIKFGYLIREYVYKDNSEEIEYRKLYIIEARGDETVKQSKPSKPQETKLKRGSQLKEDFQISDNVKAWIERKNFPEEIDIDYEFERFINFL